MMYLFEYEIEFVQIINSRMLKPIQSKLFERRSHIIENVTNKTMYVHSTIYDDYPLVTSFYFQTIKIKPICARKYYFLYCYFTYEYIKVELIVKQLPTL